MRELTGYREAVARGVPEAIYPELHDRPAWDPELGVVIVGSYNLAKQVLDTRTGDFANAATLAPLYRPEDDVIADLGEVFPHGDPDDGDEPSQGLAVLDGAAHRDRRRRARAAFNAAPQDGDDTQAVLDGAVADLEAARRRGGGTVDIVATFIEPLAMHDFQLRTGIPDEMADDLRWLLKGQVELLWGLPDPGQQRKLVKELRQVWETCIEAMERVQAGMQGCPHASNIISGYAADEGLSAADRLDIYGHINAGYISNVHTLSNVVVHALEEPGRWRALGDDPSLVPEFVDRTVETHSGVHGWFKVAAAESGVDLGDEHVGPGTRFLVLLSAANQAPDRRPGDPSLAFSHGPHLCLGRDFATRLLHNGLAALVSNYPDARLAAEPRHWSNLAFNGHPAADVVLA